MTNFRTLAEVRSTALAPRRVVVALIGIFGLLALVITAAGIAGVIAFSVNQRTQEFGIRMALGARAQRRAGAGDPRRAGASSAIGLGIGMAGALVLTRLLGAVIFDPPSRRSRVPGRRPDAAGQRHAGDRRADLHRRSRSRCVVVAVIACLMPARRAASVDPMVALRAQ